MDEDLRRVLAEQATAIAEISKNTKKICKYIQWQRIHSWLNLAIVIIPLIAGAIYLPPLVKDLIDQYSSVLR